MKFDKSKVDYLLYLVTNRELIPEGLNLYDQVQAALDNGTSVIQLREKNADTGEFIAIAEKLHTLTLAYNVPLIINDRVDVALAIDAEGVHVGQDDMDFEQARAMLGDDKILGVSCSLVAEVEQVAQSKAKVDYIGIGPVYDTATKKLTKPPFGPAGVRACLQTLLDKNASHIKSVIIGGLTKSNIQRVLYVSSVPGKSTDGVAVVSCIMAEKDAGVAAKQTLAAVKEVGPWFKAISNIPKSTSYGAAVREKNPMIHHITNDVVKNFSANVTLAIGASPIMSELEEDFPELAALPHTGLVLNTGTPTEPQIQMYLRALELYNKTGSPVVYDPVGCGASKARKLCLRRLLNLGYFSVIKGNAGEILTAAGFELNMRGVDSGVAEHKIILKAAKTLALQMRCVVVVTGAVDYVVNGLVSPQSVTIPLNVKIDAREIRGGSLLALSITGTGCSLGSVIASFVAANPEHVFELTCAAVQRYKYAAFKASKKLAGPGTFIAHFLDALYYIEDDLKSEASSEPCSFKSLQVCVSGA